jgi:hypothetical protein
VSILGRITICSAAIGAVEGIGAFLGFPRMQAEFAGCNATSRANRIHPQVRPHTAARQATEQAGVVAVKGMIIGRLRTIIDATVSTCAVTKIMSVDVATKLTAEVADSSGVEVMHIQCRFAAGNAAKQALFGRLAVSRLPAVFAIGLLAVSAAAVYKVMGQYAVGPNEAFITLNSILAGSSQPFMTAGMASGFLAAVVAVIVLVRIVAVTGDITVVFLIDPIDRSAIIPQQRVHPCGIIRRMVGIRRHIGEAIICYNGCIALELDPL